MLNTVTDGTPFVFPCVSLSLSLSSVITHAHSSLRRQPQCCAPRQQPTPQAAASTGTHYIYSSARAVDERQSNVTSSRHRTRQRHQGVIRSTSTPAFGARTWRGNASRCHIWRRHPMLGYYVPILTHPSPVSESTARRAAHHSSVRRSTVTASPNSFRLANLQRLTVLLCIARREFRCSIGHQSRP